MQLYIKQREAVIGPLSLEKITAALAAGRIQPDAKVSENCAKWYPVSALKALTAQQEQEEEDAPDESQAKSGKNDPAMSPPPPMPSGMPYGQASAASPYGAPPAVPYGQSPLPPPYGASPLMDPYGAPSSGGTYGAMPQMAPSQPARTPGQKVMGALSIVFGIIGLGIVCTAFNFFWIGSREIIPRMSDETCCIILGAAFAHSIPGLILGGCGKHRGGSTLNLIALTITLTIAVILTLAYVSVH